MTILAIITLCAIIVISTILIYAPIRHIYTVYGVLKLTESEYDVLRNSLVRYNSDWLDVLQKICSTDYVLTKADLDILTHTLLSDTKSSMKTINNILWKLRFLIKESKIKKAL
jgi:hypothetical protein